MSTVIVHGIDFFYREAGRGSPVLLIHGAAGNADVWSSIFDALARDHRVIAYDRRAHTRTNAGPPSIEESYFTHVEDAAALLRALSAAPAIVVGWSSGGLIALHLASRYPELIAGLILEEPPLQLTNLSPEEVATYQRVEQLAGEGRLRDAAETFLRLVLSYRTGGTAFDALDPALRESMLANATTFLVELRAGTGEDLTADRLQRITCPVTCLVGDLTPQVFVDATERLVGLVPQARVTRIAGAAHAMHIDQPVRFVDAVRSAVVAWGAPVEPIAFKQDTKGPKNMKSYAIRRRNAWASPELLQGVAARSREIGEEMADRVSWIRSYVVQEADGTLGSVCIYEATDADTIREHAARVGLPADEILEIADTAVVRPDPQRSFARDPTA